MAQADSSGGDIAGEANGMAAAAIVRPRVFLDVHVGTEPIGRIVMELFVDKTPKTCENFRALCTSQSQNKEQGYKFSVFHRIIDDFMIQGGDITKGDGTGGKSIYGDEFEDENLGWRDIDKEGLVCMANRGKDTNSSQFFITLAPCPHLNAKHTVFGQVVSGQSNLERMAKVRVDKNDRPVEEVIIGHCGELERRQKAPAASANGGKDQRKLLGLDGGMDDAEDRRGRKRRRHESSEDERRSLASASPASSPRRRHKSHKTASSSHRHHHHRRHHRHDRSISHDSNLRGRSRTQLRSTSRSHSPMASQRLDQPRNGRSRSPARHHDRPLESSHRRHHRRRRSSDHRPDSASRSPEHDTDRRDHRRYRSRSRSLSRSRDRRRRYRRRTPPSYFARPDEDLIRREEEQREFEGGQGRYEGVIEQEDDGGYQDDRDDGSYGRNRGPRASGGYPGAEGRLGGGVGGRFGDGGGGGGGDSHEEDADGVKFKGRGSMKFREKRRW